MISKLGVGTLLTVAMFIATPSNGLAATSSGTKAKINKFFRQLNRLPNAAAPTARVNSLVKKLTRLNPRGAKRYYTVGLRKLSNQGGVAENNATKIALAVIKLVRRSDLPSNQIRKIANQVRNVNLDYIPPSPTSMLGSDAFLVLA